MKTRSLLLALIMACATPALLSVTAFNPAHAMQNIKGKPQTVEAARVWIRDGLALRQRLMLRNGHLALKGLTKESELKAQTLASERLAQARGEAERKGVKISTEADLHAFIGETWFPGDMLRSAMDRWIAEGEALARMLSADGYETNAAFVQSIVKEATLYSDTKMAAGPQAVERFQSLFSRAASALTVM